MLGMGDEGGLHGLVVRLESCGFGDWGMGRDFI